MYADWKAAIRPELERLGIIFEQRFGYPAGANYVAEPDPDIRPSDMRPLAALYAEIGEVSMPDVHIGYFIHRADRVTTLEADGLGDVASFGSDGGGGLIVLSPADGAIFHLPPGELINDHYRGDPTRIAADLPSFLTLLLTVVKEFAWTGQTPGLTAKPR